jgi:hypothetical protein
LELLSGKILTLNRVFHVPDSRKNLVTTSLLDQNGFTLVLGSNKIVIIRFGFYVGKSHLLNGLYKLSLMLFSNATLHFLSLSIANVEFCDSQHDRIWHVNFNTIKRMIHLDLIPKSYINK